MSLPNKLFPFFPTWKGETGTEWRRLHTVTAGVTWASQIGTQVKGPVPIYQG